MDGKTREEGETGAYQSGSDGPNGLIRDHYSKHLLRSHTVKALQQLNRADLIATWDRVMATWDRVMVTWDIEYPISTRLQWIWTPLECRIVPRDHSIRHI